MKTLPLVAALVASGCLLGCGGPVGPEAASAHEGLTGASLLPAPHYVTARRDTRSCRAPQCGGFFIRDANDASAPERYVRAFDFSGLLFPDEVEADVLGAPDGEAVLLGSVGPADTFGTSALIVFDAWRALPHFGPSIGLPEPLYRTTGVDFVCFAPPCPVLEARLLNSATTTLATEVDLSRALRPLVDEAWLLDRVFHQDAIVRAHFVDVPPAGPGFVPGRALTAARVFLQLPDRRTACPRMPLPECARNQVVTYERTVDRCTVPTGCVDRPVACLPVMPTCDQGYSLVSWTGATGCAAFACDPDFVTD